MVSVEKNDQCNPTGDPRKSGMEMAQRIRGKLESTLPTSDSSVEKREPDFESKAFWDAQEREEDAGRGKV